jgi:hypothetical protein
MGLRTTGSLAKRLILAPSGRINASSCALIDVSGILVKPRCPKVMVKRVKKRKSEKVVIFMN